MAVLGLVIERPNQTAAFYAKTLGERFPRACFGPSTAHTALRQMTDSKAPRVQRTRNGADGDASMDLYEALAKGHEVFSSWMFRPPADIPAVRQKIYGRLELARLEDLPRIIGIVRMEEDIATDLYGEASGELRKHELRRKRGPGEQKTRADFEREIHETWLYIGPLHWSSRATLCGIVLTRLEEIADEAGIEVPTRRQGGIERDQELRTPRAS
jgi:hypothetical protein